jgi:hypothetical protein
MSPVQLPSICNAELSHLRNADAPDEHLHLCLPPASDMQASAAEAIAARLAPQGDDPGLDEELDQAAAAVRASLKETYLAPDALAQFAVAGGSIHSPDCNPILQRQEPSQP